MSTYTITLFRTRPSDIRKLLQALPRAAAHPKYHAVLARVGLFVGVLCWERRSMAITFSRVGYIIAEPAVGTDDANYVSDGQTKKMTLLYDYIF